MPPQQNYHLHFVHGFLGLPSDWESFKSHFEPHTCTFHTLEKYLAPCHSPECFKTWAENFNAAVFLQDLNCTAPTQHILIGYSLGGRLALHALLNAPTPWHAAVIISANPGLENSPENDARLTHDTKWAQRFLTEDWDTVLTAWNAQGVFSQQKNTLLRPENEYSRQHLAYLLQNFSLGRQENLRHKIQSLGIPLLWLAGELDTKFAALAQEMPSVNKNISSAVIPHTGHRVPWESPHEFIKQMKLFLKKIKHLS